MWPYTGKKTYFTNLSNLDVSGSSPVPTKTGKGSLDKEYYRKFVSPAPGQLNFPANTIAEDGRVYRCYGLNNREITDLYGEQRTGRKKIQVNVMKPSKQLHERNVNRLKVVLSMPAKDRKVSLSHVTGAIMRNEIVPSETRLQNDAFLSDYVRTSTPKLPPLRRKSMQLAKNIQVKIRTGSVGRHRPSIVPCSAVEEQSDDEGSDMILPAITVDVGRKFSITDKEQTPEELMRTYRMRGALPTRRKSSFMRLFRAKEKQQEGQQTVARYYDKPITKRYERRDSVARTTEDISEQFRAVIQEQMTKTPPKNGEMIEPSLNLNIAGKNSRDTLTKQLSNDPGKTVANGYKLRHEYGKNLEKNWFKNYVMKQSKSKTRAQETRPDSQGLRLDIFYSPEPESDSEMNGSDDNGFLEDDTSIQCGGFSTVTAEAVARRRRSEKARRISNLSTGAIFEEEEPNSNEDSSQSDIEIVLKENQLIQRKTKHKMRKKRQRQLKRYKPFISEETNVVPEVAEMGKEVPLTDQEIRAIRLNLRNKERLKKLKGKRKFLQVANAVYIVAQFKRILKNIRKRKKTIIKKRQQRIAAMVAKRVALKEAKEEEADEGEEREPTPPKPTLKDQFMSEIGNKLVHELGKLNIDNGQETDDEGSDCESVVEQNKNNTNFLYRNVTTRPSKFAAEIKKVSLKDAELAHQKVVVPRRLFKRRNSIPKGGRPLEFIIEVPLKSKRKGNKNKTGKDNTHSRLTRRPPSPEIKCSCYVHNKRLEAMSRASFTSQSRLGKCHHQEVRKPKMKKIRVPTGGLFRTQSLDNISKHRPIELRELLKDIDIPAKEIKLQILDRKFRRQRRRRQRIRLSPCRLPEVSTEAMKEESDSGSDDGGSDESDKSDYEFVYGGPFVGCGVMWHQNKRSSRPQTWTAEDVDREVKKITRVFHELKECRYLRLDSFNAAIMAKLNEKKHLL